MRADCRRCGVNGELRGRDEDRILPLIEECATCAYSRSGGNPVPDERPRERPTIQVGPPCANCSRPLLLIRPGRDTCEACRVTGIPATRAA